MLVILINQMILIDIFLSHYILFTSSVIKFEGDQSLPPQNMPCWHKRCFELKAISPLPSPFLSKIRAQISLCKGVSLSCTRTGTTPETINHPRQTLLNNRISHTCPSHLSIGTLTPGAPNPFS